VELSKVDHLLWKEKLQLLNEEFRKMGLAELAVVKPGECKPRHKNARYFKAEKFQQLIRNIKKDGRLESVPLVTKNLEIISGHHRIDAAKEAGIEYVLVMILDSKNKNEITSKQLSHNALVGEDDETLLKELLESINDVDWRIAAGIDDEVLKVNYETINFRIGSFREFSVLFLPENVQKFDEIMQEVAENVHLTKGKELRITSIEYFEQFGKVLRKIKKTENIKSNGIAFNRMVELAEIGLQIVSEGEEDEQ
jgi:hypothetical protein